MTIRKEIGEVLGGVENDPRLQLLEVVRDTRTLDGGIPIYQKAKISLSFFDPKDLYPIAKYVLKANLEFLLRMREEIEKGGVDIFRLDRIYYDSIYTIAPPIVEISDGVPAIVDGLHRCYLARQMKKEISVVLVDGVDSNYPLISTPVSWGEVIEYSQRPEVPELLRNIRPGIGDKLRKFYRDFSRLGSLGRRPMLNQTG